MPMRARGRTGFSLVELLVAMVVGVIVLMLATQIVLAATQSITSGDARASVDRTARFLGLSLQRDLQEAGVDLESSVDFGSVHAYGDTLAILRVPYEGSPAMPSREYPSQFSVRPAAGTGTCAATCLDVARGTAPFEPQAGDVLLLQVANARRLVVAGTTSTGSGTAVLNWPDLPTGFLGRRYGLRNPDLRLDAQPLANLVRRLEAQVYYRQGDALVRATRFNPLTGAPDGQVIATGVTSFRVWLHFVDGDSASTANGSDADATNDPNDLVGVSVVAVLAPDPNDIRRGYSASPKTVRWFYAPRNLAYERNRI